MAKVVLKDFWAPWCGPCRLMAPVIEEMKKELGDQLEVVEINVDEDGDTASKYGVMSIPTYVAEVDGKEVGRRIGLTPKAEMMKLVNA